MGVPGLWEILHPAARSTPLTVLALEAFNNVWGRSDDGDGGTRRSNPRKGTGTGTGALRVGVDARLARGSPLFASSVSPRFTSFSTPPTTTTTTTPSPTLLTLPTPSLWIFHAKSPQGGLNPFLRTMLFKVLKLIEKGILVVFVFDGPNKPSFKRNNRISGDFGRNDHSSKSFKELLNVCGWCWWDAPGEAEAELAKMSRVGLIDFVLTDDVDALLFGATRLLRNPSRTLTGANKSSLPVFETKETYQVYTLSEIKQPRSNIVVDGEEGNGVGLDTDGMIFIALCSGGDYHPAGIPNCGIRIAYALALAGFSTELLHSYRTLPRSTFLTYLPSFIDALKQELSTNSKGFLPNRRKALANSLPGTFPDLEVLDHYVRPVVSSEESAWPGFEAEKSTRCGPGLRRGRGDPRGWAKACEKWFEWGYADEIGRKMRTLAWRGEIITGTMELLGKDHADQPTVRRRQRSDSATGSQTPRASYFSHLAPVTPFPPPRLLKIHAIREHPSTQYTPEYRVEYDPSEWTNVILAAIDGTRSNPNTMPDEDRAALGIPPRAAAAAAASQEVPSSASEYEESSVDGESGAPRRPSRNRLEVDLDSSDKVWIPAAIIKAAYPEMVTEYEKALAAKELQKTPKKGKTSTKAKSKTIARDAQCEKQQMLMSNWLAGAKVLASQPDKDTTRATVRSRRPATAQSPVVIDITDSPDRTPARSSPSVIVLSSRTARAVKRHNPPSTSSSTVDEGEPVPRRLFAPQSTTENRESAVLTASAPTERPIRRSSSKSSPVKSPRTERQSYAGTLRSPSPTPTPKAHAHALTSQPTFRSSQTPKSPSPNHIIDLSGDDEDVEPATGDRNAQAGGEEEEEEEETLEPTPPRQRQARLERQSKSRSASAETNATGRVASATSSTGEVRKTVGQSRLPFVTVRGTTISAVEKEPRVNHLQKSKSSSLSSPPHGTPNGIALPSDKASARAVPAPPSRQRTKVKYRLVYEDDEEQHYERVVLHV